MTSYFYTSRVGFVPAVGPRNVREFQNIGHPNIETPTLALVL